MSDIFEPLAAPEPDRPKRARKKKEPAVPVTEDQVTEALGGIFRDDVSPEAVRRIANMLVEACEAKKIITTPRGYKCQKCGCPHMHSFETTDYATALKASDLLLDRIMGRPGTAAGEDAGVVVKLVTVGAEE